MVTAFFMAFERGAIAALRGEDLRHPIGLDFHSALVVDAAIGLDRLQVIGKRGVVLAQLGVHFRQIVQRIGGISGNIQLLPQFVGLLQIRERVLILPLIHLDGTDVMQAQRLSVLITQLALDLRAPR